VEVRGLLQICKERDESHDASKTYRKLAAGLVGAGLKGAVELLSLEQAGKAVARSVKVEPRVLVRLAYGRTLALVRETVQNLDKKELFRYFSRKLTRAVQGLVSLATQSRRDLFELTFCKGADEYGYSHPVNTCLLAILLGQQLKLPRAQLVPLGVAALLHGVGKLRSKGDGQHHYRGIGAILETRRLDDVMLTATVVAFEHDAADGVPKTRKPLKHLHPFSEIVAICATYDELTTAFGNRISQTPQQAIQQILQGQPRAFDLTLVRLFAKTVNPDEYQIVGPIVPENP
jgi:HD-GYP domain-containing protein (c-di-GMP phosphodiesterase class II)